MFRSYKNKLESLERIQLKTIEIDYRSINYFDKSAKNHNDEYNKLREYIIGAIINKDIHEDYYKYSRRWDKLRKQLDAYIELLYGEKYAKVKCIHKAGRKHHYDFKLLIDEKEFNVEFKFNTSNVIHSPQFVSPMYPSKYINMQFEEWFYDNYLSKIATYGNLVMPTREVYLRQIHNNKVECMTQFKDKYDTNIHFNRYCKKIDKEAIKQFIQMSYIKIDLLSAYLLDGQCNKVYMCYNKDGFHYDKLNENIYKIVSLYKKENTNYVYLTESGMMLEIKLRFKNGCGLQFPAFQIKQKTIRK